MALTFTFSMVGAPPSFSNSRLHHMQLYRLKREWKDATWKLAHSTRNQKGQPLPTEQDTGRQVIVVMERVRILDDDNAYSAVKPIVDGLKESLVWDDGQPWATVKVEQRKVKGYRNQRVVVIVEVP